MNTAVATVSSNTDLITHAQTATQMKSHLKIIQDVVGSVMKDNVHYGKIPGTGQNAKPALLKPGAEILCVTFRIAPSFEWEDLSDHDSVRYRVKCKGTHQLTGVLLGEGVGECSSNEEKYKWRRPICKEEFDDTPEDRRRERYRRGQGGGHYKEQQIRMEPADIANTILKMAAKRAQVAMTINATGCSDMFTQDLEDLDPDVAAATAGEDRGPPRGQPATNPPQAKGATNPAASKADPPNQQAKP